MTATFRTICDASEMPVGSPVTAVAAKSCTTNVARAAVTREAASESCVSDQTPEPHAGALSKRVNAIAYISDWLCRRSPPDMIGSPVPSKSVAPRADGDGTCDGVDD